MCRTKRDANRGKCRQSTRCRSPCNLQKRSSWAPSRLAALQRHGPTPGRRSTRMPAAAASPKQPHIGRNEPSMLHQQHFITSFPKADIQRINSLLRLRLSQQCAGSGLCKIQQTLIKEDKGPRNGCPFLDRTLPT